MSAVTIHASCVAIGGQAVLMTGPSGAGKSDLALRLIDRGAVLVADDRTVLKLVAGELRAAPLPDFGGLIELRQVGILRLPFSADVPVALYVELNAPVERLPEPASVELLGQKLRYLRLNAFEASTSAKIRMALVYPLANT